MLDIISSDDTPCKYCSRCKQWKPATSEFFQVDNGEKGGFRYICKACRSKRPVNNVPEGQRQCTKCKKIYPATTDFFRKHSRGDLRPHCRQCEKEDYKIYNTAHAEYHQQWYQEHKDKINEKQRHYWQTHREEMREREKQRYRLHTEDYLRFGREYRRRHQVEVRARKQRYQRTHAEAIRQYRRKHAEQYNTHSRNRQARKKAIPGIHTASQIAEQLERQRYRCYYAACGFAKFKKDKNGKYIYAIEHTFPITREDARNDISHLVLACPSCNSKKGNKYPWEWFEGGRLL